MLRFDPFREIEELQQRFDRALGGGTRGSDQNFFSPVVDIHEDERGLEIDLDLPGISPENIRVEAENNTITIQGERRYEGPHGPPHRADPRTLRPHLQHSPALRPEPDRGELRERCVGAPRSQA